MGLPVGKCRESYAGFLPPTEHHHGLEGFRALYLKFAKETAHLLITGAVELCEHVLDGREVQVEGIG
jgi:hypothetical protein